MSHTPTPTQTQTPHAPAVSGSPTRYVLNRRTLAAAVVAIALAQLGLAMPAVLNGLFQQDLGTSSIQLTWISDAFLVPVTLLELTFGVVGDLFGRKRLLAIGAALMAVGELIGFATPLAGTPGDSRTLVLWVGMIVAGIGAAAIMPTSLAMVAAGTHTAEQRGRGIAIWAAALATGSFLSPVIGGFLAQFPLGGVATAAWRWAFLAVAIVAVLSIVLTLAIASNSSAPLGRSLDWPGQITIAIALFALLFAIIQGSAGTWASPVVVVGFVVAAVFFALFIVVERRSPAPLLRLQLFSSRAFSIAAIATVFGMFAYLATAYTTSIRMAAIQGFTPLVTSIAFVLINVGTLILLPVNARLMHRVNPRWVMAAGFTLIAIGDLWMSMIPAANLNIVVTFAPLALVGFGFALAMPAVTGVAVNTVPRPLAGMASGTTSLLRDFGFTLAPAVIGSIALSNAAGSIQATIANNPKLAAALEAFNASAANAPAAQKPGLEAAIGAVNSGPLGANGVPATIMVDGKAVPFNPLKDVAFAALDHAYAIGYVVAGCAALVATALVVLFIRGRASDAQVAEESLVE